ncbi:uncharacterized protein LOC131167401 [Malania oleifera]|uniref:uncharacterized protein LOC131167401 n=1 Tax=Malania oleifera TaxID=397392 RepID=UPI0025ADE10F|nr:uncharacterized protein LOC131167401 [Malania oleifera]
MDVDMIDECVNDVISSILSRNPLEEILQPESPSMSNPDDPYEEILSSRDMVSSLEGSIWKAESVILPGFFEASKPNVAPAPTPTPSTSPLHPPPPTASPLGHSPAHQPSAPQATSLASLEIMIKIDSSGERDEEVFPTVTSPLVATTGKVQSLVQILEDAGHIEPVIPPSPPLASILPVPPVTNAQILPIDLPQLLVSLKLQEPPSSVELELASQAPSHVPSLVPVSSTYVSTKEGAATTHHAINKVVTTPIMLSITSVHHLLLIAPCSVSSTMHSSSDMRDGFSSLQDKISNIDDKYTLLDKRLDNIEQCVTSSKPNDTDEESDENDNGSNKSSDEGSQQSKGKAIAVESDTTSDA